MKEATVEETKVPSFPTYGATVGGKCRNKAGRWRGSCLCCWIPMHGSRSSSSLYHVLCLGGCTFSKSVCEPWVCVRCWCQLKCPQPWAQRQQLRPIHFPDELSPAGGEVTSPKVIYGIVDFSFLHFQLFATYTRERTPSHIAIHCTPSSIRLLFLETFYSCFIAFIPQIALIFTHIDEAIHLSGTRKWLEWDMRVIWSVMSFFNILNRLLRSVRSFSEESRWANPHLGLFLRQMSYCSTAGWTK